MSGGSVRSTLSYMGGIYRNSVSALPKNRKFMNNFEYFVKMGNKKQSELSTFNVGFPLLLPEGPVSAWRMWLEARTFFVRSLENVG